MNCLFSSLLFRWKKWVIFLCVLFEAGAFASLKIWLTWHRAFKLFASVYVSAIFGLELNGREVIFSFVRRPPRYTPET